MSVTIVAFVGKMESGKTTAAQYLVDKHQYKRIRFADTLKSMLRVVGLSEREIDGDLKACVSDKLCGKTPRHAMQTLGTEWGRNLIGGNFWVECLEREMFKHINCGATKFVIDDVRFLSESNWVDTLRPKMKVGLIRLIRGSDRLSAHQSEIEQEQITTDWTIYNDYDIGTLYRNVDDVLELVF